MTREEFMDIVYSELYSDGDNYRANRIIDAADEYAEDSSSEKPNKWIPVSERLPDECDYKSCYEVEDGAVLWTNEDGLVGMGYYYESTKTWSDIEDNPIAVIAWMPLLSPYQPQEGSDKE